MSTTRPDPALVAAIAVVALALATPVRSVALAPVLLFVVPITVDRVLTHVIAATVDVRLHPRPDTTSVGEPITVLAAVDGPHSMICRLVRIELDVDGCRATVRSGACAIPLRPGSVGLIDHLDVVIRVRWLGVASSTHRRRVALDTTVHCGPSLGARTSPLDVPLVGGSSATRGYVPGDRPSRINWSATARTGTLLVRSSADDDEELVVVVDSSDADPADLDWLSHPGDIVVQWWEQRGSEVRLITRELACDGVTSVVVDAWVLDRTDLLRRLARVQTGPMPVDHHPDALRVGPPETAG